MLRQLGDRVGAKATLSEALASDSELHGRERSTLRKHPLASVGALIEELPKEA